VRIAFSRSDQSPVQLLALEGRARAGIAAQLSYDRELKTSDKTGDLHDNLLGDLHKAGNLVSLNLAEVFVIHRATSTCRSRSLEC
jgi:hypothetical protein